MNKYTDEDLENLSEEELADLTAEDDEEEGADGDTEAGADDGDAAAQAAAAADDGKAEADAGKDGGQQGDKAKAEEERTKAGADDGQGDGGEDGRSEPEEKPTPRRAYQPPVNFDEKFDALAAKKDELAVKFDEGEITAVEYRQQLKPLEQEERQLIRDSVRVETREQVAQENWGTAVATFLADNTVYEAGSPLYTLLDQQVRQLQADAANPYDPALLKKAHDRIVKDLERMTGARPKPKDAGDTEEPGETDKPAKETQAKKPQIPPTLGGLPSSDLTETEDSSGFAHLDRLEGEAFEAALAKLSDTDRDRYLSR